MVFWAARKEALKEPWDELYQNLLLHMQSVIRQNKNLLLLQEMLETAQHPDRFLVADMMEGFLLAGRLRRSGTLDRVEYETATETVHSLRTKRQERVLERIRANGEQNVEVAMESHRKSEEKVKPSKRVAEISKKARKSENSSTRKSTNLFRSKTGRPNDK